MEGEEVKKTGKEAEGGQRVGGDRVERERGSFKKRNRDGESVGELDSGERWMERGQNGRR